MKIVANFTNVTFNYCKQSLYCSYQGQCCRFESFVNFFALKKQQQNPSDTYISKRKYENK